MKSTFKCGLMLICLCIINHYSQAQNFTVTPVWVKTLGTTGLNEQIIDICKNADGSLLMTGSAVTDPRSSNTKTLLVRTDTSGNLIWSKVMTSGLLSYGFKVLATADNYNIIGSQCSFLDKDAILVQVIQIIKTDRNGGVVWCKHYKSTPGMICTLDDMVLNKKGNIVVGAEFNQPFIYSYQKVIMELKATDGTILWSKKIGKDDANVGLRLCATTDSGYALTYENESAFAGSKLIAKTNSVGTILWSVQQQSNAGIINASGIKEAEGQNLIISGNMQDTSVNAERLFDYSLLKLTSAGKLLWTKNYKKALDDRSKGLVVNGYGNKGYIVYGNESPYTGNFDTHSFLLEADRNTGAFVNASTRGQTVVRSLISVTPGHFFVAGATMNIDGTNYNAAIMKNDKSLVGCDGVYYTAQAVTGAGIGRLTLTSSNYTIKDSAVPFTIANKYSIITPCSTTVGGVLPYGAKAQQVSNIQAISLYPNPVVTQTVTAKFISNKAFTALVQITSTQGMAMFKKKIYIAQGSNNISLDVQGLTTGIYTISISEGEQQTKAMFTVVR